jgi:DNA-directed RNA polymerase specialized sigma24 family protein
MGLDNELPHRERAAEGAVRAIGSSGVRCLVLDPDPVRDLVDALKTLSPQQRLAIVLHDYADRPTTEVAAILGSSRATVHVHLSAARKRLRPLLEEHIDA